MILKKEKETETNIKDIQETISKLIKDQKIIFEFYNSNIPLELLQICYNKKENKLELCFRDIQQYHIDELKKINKEIQANKKD